MDDQINNPLIGRSKFLEDIVVLNNVLSAFVTWGFVIGIIVFFFSFIIGAIKWISSGGDKGKLEEARASVVHALIGLIVMFSIFAVIKLVEYFFNISILQINLSNLLINQQEVAPPPTDP